MEHGSRPGNHRSKFRALHDRVGPVKDKPRPQVHLQRTGAAQPPSRAAGAQLQGARADGRPARVGVGARKHHHPAPGLHHRTGAANQCSKVGSLRDDVAPVEEESCP